MEKRAPRTLLPGVQETGAPPPVVFASKSVVQHARRKKVFHDVFDVVLLMLVDAFFLAWPRARVPLLDRHQSLMLLLAVNLALAVYLWLSRAVPRWRARRLSSTWSPLERSRFGRKRNK